VEPASIPSLVPGLEIGPDRTPGATITVTVPPDRYFEVSPATARLLRAIDGRRSIDDLAREVSSEPRLSAAELSDVIERTLVARGLVHFGSPPAPTAGPRSRLWLRVPLFPGPVVEVLATPFAWMFRAPAAIALGLAGLAAHAWFYAAHPDFGPPLRLGTASSGIVPLLLLIGALLLHEFGHAAALRSRGERPGAIGFGVYWFWPLLFADVPRAQRLAPRERAVVDAGGLMVQLVAAAALIAWWSRYPGQALARGIVLIDLALITNLNPLMRWDGYWLLADLTGVRDMRRRAFAHVFARLGGRPSSEPGWMTLYVILSTAALIATVFWIARGVLPRLIG